jgi:hypothetical protein
MEHDKQEKEAFQRCHGVCQVLRLYLPVLSSKTPKKQSNMTQVPEPGVDSDRNSVSTRLSSDDAVLLQPSTTLCRSFLKRQYTFFRPHVDTRSEFDWG